MKYKFFLFFLKIWLVEKQLDIKIIRQHFTRKVQHGMVQDDIVNENDCLSNRTWIEDEKSIWLYMHFLWMYMYLSWPFLMLLILPKAS